MTDTTVRKSPWLRSPIWDGFWMLSGVWLIVPIILFAMLPGAVSPLLIIATLILWLSHRFATTFTAFCTPAYRELVRKQFKRFFIFPTVAFLVVFVFVFAPAGLLPLNTLDRILVLGTIFFIYNTYHFGVQHYGVLSIFRIRAGQSPKTRFKSYERYLCLIVGGLFVALAQVYHGAQVVQDSVVYQFIPQELLNSTFAILQLIVPIAIVLMVGYFFLHEFREEQPSRPKIIYVAGLAAQGILAYFLEPLIFLFLWGVQHWLVSVALAGHMVENDTSAVPTPSRWYAFWQHFTNSFWRTVFALAVISIVLTPFFEYALHRDTIATGPVIMALFAPLHGNTFFVNLFVALGFATVFLHFIMDRAVFRFSDSEVRQITGPLLFKSPA